MSNAYKAHGNSFANCLIIFLNHLDPNLPKGSTACIRGCETLREPSTILGISDFRSYRSCHLSFFFKSDETTSISLTFLPYLINY